MLRQRTKKPKKTSNSSKTAPGSSKGHSSRLTRPPNAVPGTMEAQADAADDPRQPLLKRAKPGISSDTSAHQPVEESSGRAADEMLQLKDMSRKSQWIILAVASGCCAAFNGMFAKLTTTELTTSFATGIANLIGLAQVEKGVEVVVRALFFGLNLIFNGVMWALFTKALARGTSTTQVSIINTSSNFMVTAVLGFIIFSESLPPLWWLGAALLVAGNVIIGRREEDEGKKPGEDAHEQAENGDGRYSSEEEDELLVTGSVELDEDLEARKRRREEDDILNLGSDDDGAKVDDDLLPGIRT